MCQGSAGRCEGSVCPVVPRRVCTVRAHGACARCVCTVRARCMCMYTGLVHGACVRARCMGAAAYTKNLATCTGLSTRLNCSMTKLECWMCWCTCVG